jgi:hypothetical protein
LGEVLVDVKQNDLVHPFPQASHHALVLTIPRGLKL